MWTGYLLIPIKSCLLSCKCNLKYSKWLRSKWRHWQLYVALPHIFPHCQHIPVGLLLEGNRAESFCFQTLSCPCMDLTECQNDKNLVPPPKCGFVHGAERTSLCWNSFLWTLNRFLKKKIVLATQAKKPQKYESNLWPDVLPWLVRWSEESKSTCLSWDESLSHYCWTLDNGLDCERLADKSQTGSLLGILFLSFFVGETWC